MASALVSAAFSVLGKALAPLTDGLLKDWAVSVELGDNVWALELELKATKALLRGTLGKEINNPELEDLLVMLQDLGYDADDVLDEMDYFRIQDQLHGTFTAAEEHAKGWAYNLALHAKAVSKQIILKTKSGGGDGGGDGGGGGCDGEPEPMKTEDQKLPVPPLCSLPFRAFPK
ncbi:hypothetical protein HU200_061053 [Digitaria exilis]|uniref:Disease resistance N-terminal domain-containing protein n=1 Tax=Digitaria exilis TaxID=1010633 RepID=A0A835A907_9POAL|nr:hypothetical protein HU200_061053 [Digitaria exilis]